jgi:hypothetical protein
VTQTLRAKNAGKHVKKPDKTKNGGNWQNDPMGKTKDRRHPAMSFYDISTGFCFMIDANSLDIVPLAKLQGICRLRRRRSYGFGQIKKGDCCNGILMFFVGILLYDRMNGFIKHQSQKPADQERREENGRSGIIHHGNLCLFCHLVGPLGQPLFAFCAPHWPIYFCLLCKPIFDFIYTQKNENWGQQNVNKLIVCLGIQKILSGHKGVGGNLHYILASWVC